MVQTQPLVKQPSVSQSSLQPAVALTSAVATSPGEAEPDGMVNILAIVALLVSLISLGLVFMAWNASALS